MLLHSGQAMYFPKLGPLGRGDAASLAWCEILFFDPAESLAVGTDFGGCSRMTFLVPFGHANSSNAIALLAPLEHFHSPPC